MTYYLYLEKKDVAWNQQNAFAPQKSPWRVKCVDTGEVRMYKTVYLPAGSKAVYNPRFQQEGFHTVGYAVWEANDFPEGIQ